MAAATTAKKITHQGENILHKPVRAGVKLFHGALASVLMATGNAGFAVPTASVGTAQFVAGVVRVRSDGTSLVDNTDGANGDLNVEIETDPAWIAQDGSIAADDVFQHCFATDDSTVALTGTHRAGVILAVDATKGVLVGFLLKPIFTPITVAATAVKANITGAADITALKAALGPLVDDIVAIKAGLVTQNILA